MKTIKHNGFTLEMHDSIQEMKSARFAEYNRYIMLDAGIGSDTNSVASKINTVARYIHSGDKDNALQELQNMHQNILFVISKTSPKMNAFASLIKSIDGEPFEDLSDESIERVLKRLDRMGLPMRIYHGFLDHVKKKSPKTWKFSFLKKWMRKQRNTTERYNKGQS